MAPGYCEGGQCVSNWIKISVFGCPSSALCRPDLIKWEFLRIISDSQKLWAFYGITSLFQYSTIYTFVNGFSSLFAFPFALDFHCKYFDNLKKQQMKTVLFKALGLGSCHKKYIFMKWPSLTLYIYFLDQKKFTNNHAFVQTPPDLGPDSGLLRGIVLANRSGYNSDTFALFLICSK